MALLDQCGEEVVARRLDLDLTRKPDPALQLERVLGLSRGRSGTARGVLDRASSESFEPFGPQSLRHGVETADEQQFAAVQTMLRSFSQLMPFIFPVLIPADSPVQMFAKDANVLFDNAPAEAIALLAATFFSNFAQRQSEAQTLAAYTETLQRKETRREIVRGLTDEQRQELTRQLQARRK